MMCGFVVLLEVPSNGGASTRFIHLKCSRYGEGHTGLHVYDLPEAGDLS